MEQKTIKKLISKTMYFLDEYKTSNANVLAKASSTRVEELVLEKLKQAIRDLELDTVISEIKYKKWT